jgi:acyl phosphate:glycerol-3-phosphate acyltransferase
MLVDTAALVAAYLLGSIPVAWLVVRRWARLDVRTVGSGNVGATNALRATTPALGLFVALADAGKGALAVWMARRANASEAAVALAAFAAVAGHVAPIWLRFRGGKGVATASGAFAVLAPLAAAVALAFFVAVVWTTRLVSLGSLAGTIALVGTAAWHDPLRVTETAAAVAVVIVLRHAANITRLRAGTERPLAI